MPYTTIRALSTFVCWQNPYDVQSYVKVDKDLVRGELAVKTDYRVELVLEHRPLP